MRQVFTEILTEIPKLLDPNYCGVVIVRPNDIKEVFDFISEKVKGFGCIRIDNKMLKFKSTKGYGNLSIRTTENSMWHYDHAGCQYTTIILDLNCFGKHLVNLEGEYVGFEPVGSSNTEDPILYMMSRMRSHSIHNPRFVLC